LSCSRAPVRAVFALPSFGGLPSKRSRLASSPQPGRARCSRRRPRCPR
jgi:hypothetical protein